MRYNERVRVRSANKQNVACNMQAALPVW
jgi:hypothetical protein